MEPVLSAPEFKFDVERVLLLPLLPFGLFCCFFAFNFPWGGDSDGSTEIGGRCRRE